MIDSKNMETEQLDKVFSEVIAETNALAEKVKRLRNNAFYIDSKKHRTLRDAYGFLELAQDVFRLSEGQPIRK